MATRDWPRIWLGPGDVPLPLGYPDWDGRWPEAVVAWHMGIAREEPRRYVPERTCRPIHTREKWECDACGCAIRTGFMPEFAGAGVLRYCPNCGARLEVDDGGEA